MSTNSLPNLPLHVLPRELMYCVARYLPAKEACYIIALWVKSSGEVNEWNQDRVVELVSPYMYETTFWMDWGKNQYEKVSALFIYAVKSRHTGVVKGLLQSEVFCFLDLDLIGTHYPELAIQKDETPLAEHHPSETEKDYKFFNSLIETQKEINKIGNHLFDLISSESPEIDEKFLIENKNLLNFKNKNGSYPLHWAIEQKKTEIAKVLIENGANLFLKDNCGSTPLHLAIQKGNTVLIDLLLETSDLTTINSQGDTLLHTFAYFIASYPETNNDNLLWKRYFQAFNQNSLNQKNKEGLTPLSIFIKQSLWCNSLNKGKVVISDLLTTENVNTTRLYYIAGTNQHEIARMLLEQGANVNSVAQRNNSTPLHLAAEKTDLDMIDLLISYGADANAKDKEGKTPLHLFMIKHTNILDEPKASDIFKQLVTRDNVNDLPAPSRYFSGSLFCFLVKNNRLEVLGFL
ncbi:MAG: ankyrin repeat domain-containing protein [Chlamydiia bacterium]|nr:ankyrin repeat domain-containing protein [Chlamydiia bacterium]